MYQMYGFFYVYCNSYSTKCGLGENFKYFQKYSELNLKLDYSNSVLIWVVIWCLSENIIGFKYLNYSIQVRNKFMLHKVSLLFLSSKYTSDCKSNVLLELAFFLAVWHNRYHLKWKYKMTIHFVSSLRVKIKIKNQKTTITLMLIIQS